MPENADATHATDAVLCACCYERGVETRMVPDTDLGGHLCPTCEPTDVQMLGRADDRLARHDSIARRAGA